MSANQPTGWAALPANVRTPVDLIVKEVRNVTQGEIRRRARVAVVGALAFAALGYVTMALSPLGAVLAFGASIKLALDALGSATLNWKISSQIERVKNYLGNCYLNPASLREMGANFFAGLDQMGQRVTPQR